ncbi:hypothetical protein Shyd_75930 [Streptomyces hydrogenans]|uniref:Uncharacterized protein n=1 Tax=Streptomyces hydrogenans TaxID=1873719 RepID=A0ABQ3PMJ4_9ACTN|nr:hypothetical protein GCM10018784_06120 [Streptomyces hydrogenans]GHI26222.1 hypothetical protein Shyd_75930 [Streptomyces hydrogenans]
MTPGHDVVDPDSARGPNAFGEVPAAQATGHGDAPRPESVEKHGHSGSEILSARTCPADHVRSQIATAAAVAVPRKT